MQMTPRRHSRGFTLVELMVVIGILGLLVGVLAVAVIPKLLEAKVDLDVQELGKFQNNLALSITDSTKRRFVRGVAPSTGKAADVFKELWDGKVLSTDDMGRLGGASGEKATEATLRAGNLNSDNIIFTGPKTGSKLLEMLEGRMEDGVMMCYNKNFYSKSAELVMIWPKEKSAKALSVAALKQEYKNGTNKEVNLKGEWEEMDASFYGKPPFQNVVPE